MPVRKYTPEVVEQMKHSHVVVKDEEEDSVKVLAMEIERQTSKIDSLEYKMQQLIN